MHLVDSLIITQPTNALIVYNPKFAYATHILENRHENGTRESTLQLLQACQKGTRMDCWEAFYIQALHQQKILITEQQISDVNPLFELAKVTNTLQLKL